MKTVSFESANHVRVDYELATPIQRLAATVVDAAVFIFYMIIIVTLTSESYMFSGYESPYFFYSVVIKLPWILYKPLFEYFLNGQSIGKLALGIRVVTMSGERPGLREIFTRWLFRLDFFWISFDPTVLLWFASSIIGFIVASTSQNRQRLGDIMSNTIVIKNRSSVRYKLNDILKMKTMENYEPKYPEVIKFTDEDMMLIKRTIQRVEKYKNEPTKKVANELVVRTADLLGLEEIPAKRLEFLKDVLQDYIVLTR